MSRVERGAYFDLLMELVSSKCLPIALVKQVLGTDFEHVWPRIKVKFVETDDGFSNELMSNLLEQRAAITEIRAKSGRKGGRSKPSKEKVSKRLASAKHTTSASTSSSVSNSDSKKGVVGENKNGTHLHKPMLDAYLAFMSELDIPPKVELADHAALKSIRGYLLTVTTEDKLLEAWGHLLSSHARWPEWNQTHLRLRDINSQIQNIVTYLKKSKKGKSAEDKHREIWQSDLYKQ